MPNVQSFSIETFLISTFVGFFVGILIQVYTQPYLWHLCLGLSCYVVINGLVQKNKVDKGIQVDGNNKHVNFKKYSRKGERVFQDCTSSVSNKKRMVKRSSKNESESLTSHKPCIKQVAINDDENMRSENFKRLDEKQMGVQFPYLSPDQNSLFTQSQKNNSLGNALSLTPRTIGGSSIFTEDEDELELGKNFVGYFSPRLTQLHEQSSSGNGGGVGTSKFGHPALLHPYPSDDSQNDTQWYTSGIARSPSIDNMRKLVDQGRKIEEKAIHEDYCKFISPEETQSEEVEEVCANILECIQLREKWMFKPKISPEQIAPCKEEAYPSDVGPLPPEYIDLPPLKYHYKMVQGVVHVYENNTCKNLLFSPVGDSREFFSDMHNLLKMHAYGPVKTFTHHRLKLLEQKFNLHIMLNSEKEFLAQKTAPHRDFYNVRKVDTHIHHTACMHQKHLLRFIKSKLRTEPDEIVVFRDGKYLTVKEVFESLSLTSYDLNVDTLDMHVDKNTFHRFDQFNSKYNPCGQSRLREVFLKNDNVIHGRYIGELTKEVLKDLESNKYQHTEFRISSNGRKQVEWDMLAQWVSMYNLYSNNNVWLIQIPRLYNVYYEQGLIENFQQMLDNLFLPLFEVTLDPSTHENLHVFLQNVVGFDTVDDESRDERRPTKTMPLPEEWDHGHNPAYSYYTYYIYANLYVLNRLRESRGLNTFAYRPHCGESGDIDHLASAFLTAENISHGCNLRKSPCLQYLYYVEQIGICMSPLSNNSLFLDYHRNPFPSFFSKGLSVSLSSDDPLQIHLTREPLVEEYSVAAQVWKLSSADLCEIARNSVLHSGYPHACKMHWVGEKYWRLGPEGNDIKKTNVPNLRIRYRYDTLINEKKMLRQGGYAYYVKKQLNQEQY